MFDSTPAPNVAIVNAAEDIAASLHAVETSVSDIAVWLHGLEERVRMLPASVENELDADNVREAFANYVADGVIDGQGWVRDYLSDHSDPLSLVPEHAIEKHVEELLRYGGMDTDEIIEAVGASTLIAELERQGELPETDSVKDAIEAARDYVDALLTTDLEDVPGAVEDALRALERAAEALDN